MYHHYLQLTEEEIKNRYERVLNEICKDASDNDNDWAREELSKIKNDLLDADLIIDK